MSLGSYEVFFEWGLYDDFLFFTRISFGELSNVRNVVKNFLIFFCILGFCFVYILCMFISFICENS